MPEKKQRSILTSKPFLLSSTLAASYLVHKAYSQTNLKSFKGENVLVTGATKGIGLLLAKGFAKEEISNLVLVARSFPDLEESKKIIQSEFPKVNVFIHSVDVGKKEQIYDLKKTLSKEVGDIDVLVLNAGIVSGKKILEQTDEDAERILQVNTLSHFYFTRAFLPSMLKKNRGHIITIASVASTIGVARMTDYCTSKFGAFAFNESLRAELRTMGAHGSNSKGSNGVQVLSMCPYYIDTGMFKNIKNNNVPWLIPILKPEDVVERTLLAAKRGEQCVVMPFSCWSIFISRALLPGRVFDRVMYDILGVQKTMQEFEHDKTGRGSIHNSNENTPTTNSTNGFNFSSFPQNYSTVTSKFNSRI